MMDTTIKAEWVRRLRDGRKQVTGKLARVNGAGNIASQCCLGVLCEMAEEAGAVKSKLDSGVVYYGRAENANELPDEVQVWAQLKDNDFPNNPVVKGIRKEGSSVDPKLAELNDHGGTFEDIALIIENSNL